MIPLLARRRIGWAYFKRKHTLPLYSLFRRLRVYVGCFVSRHSSTASMRRGSWLIYGLGGVSRIVWREMMIKQRTLCAAAETPLDVVRAFRRLMDLRGAVRARVLFSSSKRFIDHSPPLILPLQNGSGGAGGRGSRASG